MELKHISMDAVRLTEQAAIAAARYIGRGDKNAADQAAVDAMRNKFETVPIAGRVVIGEGEKDEAPMLYIGEEVGASEKPVVDIAVDPLEGTTLTAKGSRRSICVLGMAPENSLLHAPDVYMMKLAVGADAAGHINLDDAFHTNVQRVVQAKSMKMEDFTCVVLDRTRNEDIIETLRELNCRVRLIDHGDVSAALSACVPETEVDMLAGIGNSAEGVLSAIAIRCFGGDFQARFNPIGNDQYDRLESMGYTDYDTIYDLDDLVTSENLIFACTGVTEGDFLNGVQKRDEEVFTNSLLITAPDHTRRFIRSRYKYEALDDEPELPIPGMS